ncbi:MAG: DNA-methyltransferase [Spirochaetia bacterium]
MREPFGRLDTPSEEREAFAKLCRLEPGEIWEDPVRGHRVGLLDAARDDHVRKLTGGDRIGLAVNDPPYNVRLSKKRSELLGTRSLEEYMLFSRRWVENTVRSLSRDAHFYVWLGADVNDNFQPLPDFMIMMRDFPDLEPRNFITLRNQRGYGTSKNWMWVRQELLHYVQGKPEFQVIYTDIPKILKGYYKEVNGARQENMARSKSDTIRPGNVWVDIQQVFYRMEENVPGAYAQKPLKSISRILETSSRSGDRVLDLFAHSGTTLIAGEIAGRRVFTADLDPVFTELTIRRLEHFRETGKTGWQCGNPFPEAAEV